jgi:hypothetical protein
MILKSIAPPIMGGQPWIVRALVGDIDAPIGQIANARREAEAEKMAQPEDVIDRARGIGVMLADVEHAFLTQQPVENMRGLAGAMLKQRTKAGIDAPRKESRIGERRPKLL